MNAHFSPQQIRVYLHDGGTRLFAQSDVHLANQALMDLNPPQLFTENAVNILDDDGEFTFEASQLERIDLMTARLSVWDFPFVIGALVELTEREFRECVEALHGWESLQSPGTVSVFISIVMAGGKRHCFWMEVAGGLSAIRRNRICSMIRQPQLIFGLRMGGVGVLNLARMEHFSMYPEPLRTMSDAQSAGYKVRRNDFNLPAPQFFREIWASPNYPATA